MPPLSTVGAFGLACLTGSNVVLVTVTGALALCKSLERRRMKAVLSRSPASSVCRMQSFNCTTVGGLARTVCVFFSTHWVF